MSNEDSGYLEFMNDLIDKSLFDDEKYDFEKAIKFLGMSQNEFLLSVKINNIKKEDENNLPDIDFSQLANTKFIKIVEEKAQYVTDEDIETLKRLNIISLRISIILLEYIKKNDGVNAALEYLKYILKNFYKIEGRLFGEEYGSNIIKQYREHIERTIIFLNDEINKAKQSNPIIKGQLRWIGSQTALKKISNELKLKGFTNNPTDFEKVFTQNKPTYWMREPEYLAYLLECLYSHKNKQFIATNGGKFKIAEQLFCDNLKKSHQKIILSKMLYNVTKRQAEKHTKLRMRVDSFVSTYIN